MPVRAVAPVALLILWVVPAWSQSAAPRYVNPPGLVRPNGYTHVVVAADGRTAYIAGQVAFDSTGAVVGPGDFQAQAERVFVNLGVALASVGASFGDILKTTTYVTDPTHVALLREIRTRHLDRARPPANTLLVVAGLARPVLLLEIEAVVALPGKRS
jgi:enamine deaminase RidA (YjgF/YER057c/UK114 family)